MPACICSEHGYFNLKEIREEMDMISCNEYIKLDFMITILALMG